MKIQRKRKLRILTLTKVFFSKNLKMKPDISLTQWYTLNLNMLIYICLTLELHLFEHFKYLTEYFIYIHLEFKSLLFLISIEF